ncbi:MAG: ATP-binding cassette domain-containing protein [Acidimicrobiales bacterium]
MADQPLFEFEAVVVEADGQRILDGVSTAIPMAAVAVVAGPSGSGKSTLLRLCNRLEVPASGTVRYRGEDVAGLDPLAHRRRVGMVFQRPTPFPGTVGDNLRVACPDLSDAACGLALERVHLDPAMVDRDTGTLSGGEAQRACLARTLVANPEVVLLDEPTSSLDESATRSLEELAAELAASGVPIVWVTHDLGQLRRVAHHLVVMDRGRVVASGSPEDLDDHPLIRKEQP